MSSPQTIVILANTSNFYSDRYLMAAADQPNGTRASRLAQVIKAKYDAGLLKPYDYVKGYERMNKWMESGRAAPKMDSRAGSEAPEESPQRSTAAMRNGRLSITRAFLSFRVRVHSVCFTTNE